MLNQKGSLTLFFVAIIMGLVGFVWYVVEVQSNDLCNSIDRTLGSAAHDIYIQGNILLNGTGGLNRGSAIDKLAAVGELLKECEAKSDTKAFKLVEELHSRATSLYTMKQDVDITNYKKKGKAYQTKKIELQRRIDEVWSYIYKNARFN